MEIAELCRKYGCYVISDEIYSEQTLSDDGHCSIA
jgi:bifunctional pyridoxal-dependent enzyme with beta-cystathionase and maltose regulon repressor activities